MFAPAQPQRFTPPGAAKQREVQQSPLVVQTSPISPHTGPVVAGMVVLAVMLPVSAALVASVTSVTVSVPVFTPPLASVVLAGDDVVSAPASVEFAFAALVEFGEDVVLSVSVPELSASPVTGGASPKHATTSSTATMTTFVRTVRS
jgi:hypothetical protein